jgi:hypothetical protein
MVQNQKSMAALSTTYVRAYHHTHDTPKIFDDEDRTNSATSLAWSHCSSYPFITGF